MTVKEIINQMRSFLSTYRTTDEILDYLKQHGLVINSRKWQDMVLKFNEDYGEHQTYLAGSSKGYILTTEKESIKQANYQKIRKAVSMIRNAKRDLDTLGLKNQLTCLDEECDSIEQLIDRASLHEEPLKETKYEEIKLHAEGIYF